MKIYLAGPHLANGYRARAKELLSEHECVDPFRPERDFRGIETGNQEEIIRGDLIDIAAADAVLANWTERAVGTSMECWYAFSIGRPIYGFVQGERISPWYAYVAQAVTQEIEDAIHHLLYAKAAP